MSRSRKKRGDDDSELDMTPMLDIVFIMLIFFIVTATFVKEQGLDVTRPDNQETQVKKDRPGILISLNGQGQVWVNKRKIDVRSVRANVERLLAENPEGSVVIRAENETEVDVLVQVMDQARSAGASVSIASND
ncbi:MAG: biopolymer transporter ExbD [Alphaproteobacteria bacterium]